jgi:hypothetical protein
MSGLLEQAMEDADFHPEPAEGVVDPEKAAAPTVTGTAESSRSEVLAEVQERAKARRRHRHKPPTWALWTMRQSRRAKSVAMVLLPQWLRTHRSELVSYAFSLAFLSCVAFIMALCVLPPGLSQEVFDLVVTRTTRDSEQPLEITEILDNKVSPDVLNDLNVNSNLKQLVSDIPDGPEPEEMTSIEEGTFGVEFVPTDTEMKSVYKKGEFGGRSEAGRQMAVRKFGGTVESEQAVNLGLNWLKGLQQKDGSWNFSKVGEGTKPGTLRRTEVGATSLALLCFLGGGHTHLADGPYRETVHNGLAFIGKEAIVQQGTADLRGSYEGNSGMYVHALATICISEAHALERHDKDLTKLTEMAVAYIESAQDPLEGGWRYKPRDDTGDTSVVGWQVMALQSAKAGRIRFSSKVFRLARDYLNSAQVDEIGSAYSYIPGSGGEKPTMTAVALLCRMYMGWQQDHEGLKKGVLSLAKTGPKRGDIYFNYYATQVLRHWGGDLWKQWNQKLRQQLVNDQIKDGPAAGSWPVRDPHGAKPGPIYQTALSILTLEVYYRHLPIYQRLEAESVDDGAQN